MRYVITEITTSDLHTYLAPFADKTLSIHSNLSFVCYICGSLWAQYRYHFLQDGEMRTAPMWRPQGAVCEKCSGGTLLSHETRWIPYVNPATQNPNLDLLIREFNLILALKPLEQSNDF